ncbi:aminotransferase class V-fold PLP-dependent enzyme [Micavibrio aeruginosavorus]|uniref:aminotransferase class V-fold PLP-dependent enzyme n=1 Tax=Micavibrio aeruginosavorus TaxID=349221 RepID=UPI003F4AC11C
MAGVVKMPSQNDFARYRDDFPVLARPMNGQKLAYMDTASSAQKPRAVIDALREALDRDYANIHRGLYALSQTTTQKFEATRRKVADFIGALSENEIVFTRNTTEAINLVAQSWGRTHLKAGDEIIISGMEHHANIVPWQLLRDQIGIVLKIIPVLPNGTLDMVAFDGLLSDRTRFVSIVHVSNALGTINPVETIICKAKAYNADILVLVDGSQSVTHMPVNVLGLGCDFFAFTGHKLYGPTGVGVLYGRAALLNAMPPYQGGGDMIETVSFAHTTYKPAPARFEAGTPAIAEVIALGAAIDYVASIGMGNIAAHEGMLLARLVDQLETVPGLTFYGTGPDKAGIVSFTADWGHPSDIAMILDQCGVAVRTGHHCCMPLMQGLGVEGTVRASLGLYSNVDDIISLMNGVTKAHKLLGA